MKCEEKFNNSMYLFCQQYNGHPVVLCTNPAFHQHSHTQLQHLLHYHLLHHLHKHLHTFTNTFTTTFITTITTTLTTTFTTTFNIAQCIRTLPLKQQKYIKTSSLITKQNQNKTKQKSKTRKRCLAIPVRFAASVQ